MTEASNGQNKPELLGRVLEVYKGGSKQASWIFGIGGCVFLGYVFFRGGGLLPVQCGILRFFISLIGALFFLFFVGGIVLEGKAKGLTVGAGGGAAVFFLLQFVANPIPGCIEAKHAERVEWKEGQRLEQLVDSLKDQRANGSPNIPYIDMPESDRDKIMHFNPGLKLISAETWPELLENICKSTDGCLSCNFSKETQTMMLQTSGRWTKKQLAAGQYEFSCRR